MELKLEEQKFESLKNTHTEILSKVVRDIGSTQLKLAGLNFALAAAMAADASCGDFGAAFWGCVIAGLESYIQST